MNTQELIKSTPSDSDQPSQLMRPWRNDIDMPELVFHDRLHDISDNVLHLFREFWQLNRPPNVRDDIPDGLHKKFDHGQFMIAGPGTRPLLNMESSYVGLDFAAMRARMTNLARYRALQVDERSDDWAIRQLKPNWLKGRQEEARRNLTVSEPDSRNLHKDVFDNLMSEIQFLNNGPSPDTPPKQPKPELSAQLLNCLPELKGIRGIERHALSVMPASAIGHAATTLLIERSYHLPEEVVTYHLPRPQHYTAGAYVTRISFEGTTISYDPTMPWTKSELESHGWQTKRQEQLSQVGNVLGYVLDLLLDDIVSL